MKRLATPLLLLAGLLGTSLVGTSVAAAPAASAAVSSSAAASAATAASPTDHKGGGKGGGKGDGKGHGGKGHGGKGHGGKGDGGKGHGGKGAHGKGPWKAPSGPFFNDPHTKADHFTIEKRVIDTIDHTKKGSIIRIAVYSFDRMPVADALIRAHARGVRVQMLLNDHQDTAAMRAIRSKIGGNRWAKSFIYRCVASCRGTENEFNNLHSKLYLFSQAGRSTDVVALGSANMTLNADLHQWNDLYFFAGDTTLFDQFAALFQDMKHDYSTRQPAVNFCGTPVNGTSCDDSVDKYNVWAFPRPSSPKDDLVLQMLSKIQCVYTDAAGAEQHTKLALSMHTMRGNRGDYLAAAIRQKYAEGCDFRVDYGLIGYKTKQILGAPTPRGRIPLRSTGLDYNTDDNFDLNMDGEDDLILDYYTHQKYFIVQGVYNGVPDTNMVLTGSSNWASLSTANDEIWFTVHGTGVVKKYLKNFNFEWDSNRNSRDAYTTTYSNFKVPVTARDEDGTIHTTWQWVRKSVQSVERDPYVAGGPAWESD